MSQVEEQPVLQRRRRSYRKTESRRNGSSPIWHSREAAEPTVLSKREQLCMSVQEEARTLRGGLLGFSVEAKKKANTGQKDPNLSGTVGPLRQTRVLLQHTSSRPASAGFHEQRRVDAVQSLIPPWPSCSRPGEKHSSPSTDQPAAPPLRCSS